MQYYGLRVWREGFPFGFTQWWQKLPPILFPNPFATFIPHKIWGHTPSPMAGRGRIDPNCKWKMCVGTRTCCCIASCVFDLNFQKFPKKGLFKNFRRRVVTSVHVSGSIFGNKFRIVRNSGCNHTWITCRTPGQCPSLNAPKQPQCFWFRWVRVACCWQFS